MSASSAILVNHPRRPRSPIILSILPTTTTLLRPYLQASLWATPSIALRAVTTVTRYANLELFRAMCYRQQAVPIDSCSFSPSTIRYCLRREVVRDP